MNGHRRRFYGEGRHAVPPPLPEKTGLYRARDGAVFGVCKGVARYLDFPVAWLRFFTIVAAVFTGFFWVIVLYIVAALLMKPEPVIPFKEEMDQEFYDSYMNSRKLALVRLKRTFDNIERRIQRMEAIVTARDYDWERRLNDGH
ncbi:MAG: hypothetical protein AMXMBFR84_32020 [Candidatus Hydrogenedentota bacterium]